MYRGIPRFRVAGSSIMRSFRGIPRFRVPGSSILNSLTMPQMKRKAMNTVTAIQDTFDSVKDTYDRHKVVFTVFTTVGSFGLAGVGYAMRHYHYTRIHQRLESMEKAMERKHSIEDPEVKKLVSRHVSYPACVATAGTSLMIGYVLGWRGGAWFVKQKIQKEQMKLVGQNKARVWPLKFLRRPLLRSKTQENASKMVKQKDASISSIAEPNGCKQI